MKRPALLLSVFLILLWSAPGFAKTVYPFKGELDVMRKILYLTVNSGEKGVIASVINFSSNQQVHIKSRIDDLQTPFFEVSTEVDGAIKVFKQKASNRYRIQGTIASHDSLINRRPTQECTAGFEIKDKIFHLNYLNFGNIGVQGSLDLVAPYSLNFTFRLAGVEMNNFLSFWAQNNLDDSANEGMVGGEIELSGDLSHPLVKAHLESSAGIINGREYDSIILNGEGPYPVIHFAESLVTRTNAMSFNVEGSIDLSQRKTLKQQIKRLSKSAVVNQSDTSLEWTIKRRGAEGDSSQTELKYMRRKPMDDASEEESDMLGIERSINF